jgi:hypothetical protein
MPTNEQFKETAKRLRTIIEYGVSGALIGDNEVARAAVACEMVIEKADEIERLRAALKKILDHAWEHELDATYTVSQSSIENAHKVLNQQKQD